MSWREQVRPIIRPGDACGFGILVAQGLRIKINFVWNEGMRFTAAAEGHSVSMDAKRPIGTGTALTPKELVLAGLCPLPSCSRR